MEGLRENHLSVIEARHKLVLAENGLSSFVMGVIAENGGSEIARKLNVTPGYISDLRHGRRKVSDAMVEKLEKLA